MNKTYSAIKTAYIEGPGAELGYVEIDISQGLPAINIVGLPDQSVKEAKERIRSALLNSNYKFPMQRITVNLLPGGTKKEGTHFDLPIAIGILISSGEIESKIDLDKIAFIGELSLDGKIKPIHGAMALAIGLEQAGIDTICMPKDEKGNFPNFKKAKIISLEDIKEIKKVLDGSLVESKCQHSKLNTNQNTKSLDYIDVYGQEDAKRAMEIAASGFHNLLLLGPPGAGKTMLARRLPTIMTSLSYEESLEITKITSLSGYGENMDFIKERPFRAPHHSISPIALAGGGYKGKPGEISLAHTGVLFLDEFPEFQKKSLEILRQPMEDGYINIARVAVKARYPAKFMLIAAMNPCPCGYYGHSKIKCNCSEYRISQYISGLSGPLSDRIDIFLEIYPPMYEEIESKTQGSSSKEMKKAVEKAYQIQRERYKNEVINSNSELTPNLIKKYCSLDKESEELLKSAYSTFNLSTRNHHKIIKLARTIADLASNKNIKSIHIAEAIGLNRGFTFYEK